MLNPLSKLTWPNLTKHILKYLPVISFLRTYTVSVGVSDFIAGTSVGLLLIPQGIAYAVVADLPPQYGLYSSIMGCFVYLIFGHSPEMSIAPATILALMTALYGKGDINVAIFQSFMGGILTTACGIFHLGFVIDFISMPVISGFASAAATQIASDQLKKIIGVNLTGVERSQTGFGVVDNWVDTFGNIELYKWQDLVLGLFCVVFLFSLRAVNRSNWFTLAEGKSVVGCQAFWNKMGEEKLKMLNKTVWFICTSRYALIIIICIIIAFIIEPAGTDCILTEAGCVFSLTGDIVSGLPALQLPVFLSYTEEPMDNAWNVTANVSDVSEYSNTDSIQTTFTQMMTDHMLGAVLIALIAVLQNIAIVKSFAGSKSVDANQEMIALGLCNVAGSFIGSMPVGGSFSRCALNASSGVKTSLGNIYSGILVILCLAILMPACALIPKATLGAVVFCGVVFNIEYQIIKPIWNSKPMDLLPGLSSFFVCLFYRLEVGILFGVFIQMIGLVYSSARPKVVVEVVKASALSAGHVVTIPHNTISFPSIFYVKTIINKAGKSQVSCGLFLF